jgi:hypothetical protein
MWRENRPLPEGCPSTPEPDDPSRISGGLRDSGRRDDPYRYRRSREIYDSQSYRPVIGHMGVVLQVWWPLPMGNHHRIWVATSHPLVT